MLRRRMRSVLHLVRDASKKSVRTVEYIHQLRVAIRRADAALSAFAPFVDESRARKLSKRLRAIRKAAGAARDCDVHASLLPTIISKETDKNVPIYLQRRLKAVRKQCSRDVREACSDRRARKLGRSRRRAIRVLDAPSHPRSEAAKAAILTTTRAARQLAASDLSCLDNTHALRVAGKQVRYALELFGSSVPKDVGEEALTRLREFQSMLGRINDTTQMAEWLKDESLILTEDRFDPRHIPADTTPEILHEEVRVILGRVEAERDAAHAAVLPRLVPMLNAAIEGLERWAGAPEAGPIPFRAVAGRAAEGAGDRHPASSSRKVRIET